MLTRAPFVRAINVPSRRFIHLSENRFVYNTGLLRFSYFKRESHDSFFIIFISLSFFFSVFKRGVPPAEQPFIVEDMPQMHRFVYDYYSHYVESLRAQREV